VLMGAFLVVGAGSAGEGSDRGARPTQTMLHAEHQEGRVFCQPPPTAVGVEFAVGGWGARGASRLVKPPPPGAGGGFPASAVVTDR
jgi:hypothetical protein